MKAQLLLSQGRGEPAQAFPFTLINWGKLRNSEARLRQPYPGADTPDSRPRERHDPRLVTLQTSALGSLRREVAATTFPLSGPFLLFHPVALSAFP